MGGPVAGGEGDAIAKAVGFRATRSSGKFEGKTHKADHEGVLS
jgi:hypothetical protein